MMKYSGLRSTRRKTVIVAAAVAMLSTVMVVPASADGPQGRDADVEVDVAAANVPGLAELLDATDATVADGVDVHANGDSAVEFDSGDGHVEIPNDPTAGVTLTSSIGGSITVGVPGSPDKAVVASDGSVVYNNAYRDTSIVVQPQLDGGARMITVLDSPKAPTRFDYPMSLSLGQPHSLAIGGAPTAEAMSGLIMLKGMTDGSVIVTDYDGEPLLSLPAPWAYDSTGNDVSSWYSITNSTLTLNINPSASTTYPVITDPLFRHTWYGLNTMKLDRRETDNLLNAWAYGQFQLGVVSGVCAGLTVGACAVPWSLVWALSGLGRLALQACANSKGVDIHSWGYGPVTAVWCSGY